MSANNIEVTILPFSLIRETCGFSEKELTLPVGSHVIDVMNHLKKDIPELAEISVPLLYAVNNTYVTDSHGLSNGDTLAIFPPVSGG